MDGDEDAVKSHARNPRVHQALGRLTTEQDPSPQRAHGEDQRSGRETGDRQWAADVTEGRTPPSILGEAMLPPDSPPAFPWSLPWRVELPATSVTKLLTAIGYAEPISLSSDAWIPAVDVAAEED